MLPLQQDVIRAIALRAGISRLRTALAFAFGEIPGFVPMRSLEAPEGDQQQIECLREAAGAIEEWRMHFRAHLVDLLKFSMRESCSRAGSLMVDIVTLQQPLQVLAGE